MSTCITPKAKLFEQFNDELKKEQDNNLNEIQQFTRMKFHDFHYSKYAKSETTVKIDSHEKFSRKELEQKELILKELTKRLQQKLTSYEKDKGNQKLLLKEEEQKKIISQELNQIVSKNYKDESKDLLQILSDKININIVPAITTINQILETGVIDESENHLKTIKANLYEFLNESARISEYQRLIQDEQSIIKIVVNTNKMIGKVLTKQKIMADRKGIKIIFENHDVETLLCEESRILFVLNSLIGNSIKLCEKNSEIKIIVNKFKKGALIAIIDTGNGFSPKFLDEILSDAPKMKNPFAKENEIKMNMIISRMIIHNHKGEFVVISQPRQKTEVSFNIPAGISFSNK